MPIFLRGLSLQFYRGIGPEAQKLAPFKEFNFFIGANNAGKSTVLNFISDYLGGLVLPRHGQREKKGIEPLHQYRGRVTGQTRMAIAIPAARFKGACLKRLDERNQTPGAKTIISQIVDYLAEGDWVWLQSGIPVSDEFTYEKEWSAEEIRGLLNSHEWNSATHLFTGYSSAPIEQTVIPETLNWFYGSQFLQLPEVKLIPAIRQIGPKGAAFADFSGQGLIDRLAEIQSPDHDKRHERAYFDQINSFLQTVTGHQGAEIEVPHNREHILVHMDNKVLPLISLGTGIHEVIMIAAFCTLSENQIVCIEEPEIHLHPLLQRKLVKYLSENTTNQYFIATHSAAFIDTPGAAIFHVTNDGEQTRIHETILPSQKFSICSDLGYRASDIVQSNAVIWVEGPSDRIYIRHWIRALAPELEEGIHYSIMFYGGRLLSHLTANSDEVNEFISLRSLNQNLALVMDSDRKHSRDSINATKTRLKDEFSQGPGVAWITKGREIENYIDHNNLQAAVRTIYDSAYGKPLGGGQYDHALHFERAALKKRRKAGADDESLVVTDVDKVKVARLVCDQPANLNILDLRERVEELVEMIRRANA